MKNNSKKGSNVDFSKLDLQKMYDALAMIIGRRENVDIKFTIERREQK